MKIRLIALCASFIVLSACATTNDTAGDSKLSDDDNKVAANESEVVCKREKIIGSHFTRKVCFTRDSMEDTSDETRQRLERMRNQRSSTSGDF